MRLRDRFIKIDYKKELERAAKGMILVHEPDVLIKMIIRTFIQKVRVKHAAVLLHKTDNDSYILAVSRGNVGVKIPTGFARMDSDNPLVSFFKQKKDRIIFKDSKITLNDIIRRIKKTRNSQDKDFLARIQYQLEIFQADICIPCYFRDELLAIFLLGKKRNGKKFAKEELDFFAALASDAAMAIRNAQLFNDLESELHKKYRLLIHTIIALAAAIEAKDRYTHGHTERVTNISLEIAKKIEQITKVEQGNKFIEYIRIAGLLHDIGKIGIPESILNKNGPLTDEERKKMMEHASIGAAILQPIAELEDAVLGVKYHHERYDGTGYPEGLKGNDIPLLASIIAVADTFDAMTTDRPYRPALSKESAAEEIKRLSGKQFSPLVVEAFLKLYENKEV